MLHNKKSWMKIFGLFLSFLLLFFFFFWSLEWQWAGDTSLLIIWNYNLTNKWTCKCSCKCLSGADFKAWSWNIQRFRASQGLTGLAVMLRKEEMVVTVWPQDTEQTPKNLFATQGNCRKVPVAVQVLADHHMCCLGVVLSCCLHSMLPPVSSCHPFPPPGRCWQLFRCLFPNHGVAWSFTSRRLPTPPSFWKGPLGINHIVTGASVACESHGRAYLEQGWGERLSNLGTNCF